MLTQQAADLLKRPPLGSAKLIRLEPYTKTGCLASLFLFKFLIVILGNFSPDLGFDLHWQGSCTKFTFVKLNDSKLAIGHK